MINTKNIPREQLTSKVLSRFWGKVNKSSYCGCWLWNGDYNELGYGLLSIKGRSIRAHRIAWQLQNGDIILGQLCYLDTPAVKHGRRNIVYRLTN